MISRALSLLGIVLIIVGVLKFVGIITVASAGAVVLIVVGAICILVAEYVLGGGLVGYGGRRRL